MPARPLLSPRAFFTTGKEQMPTMMSVSRLALPVSALLVCGFVSFGAARAQDTPGGVDVRQACTPDAMRLCGDVVPDVPKVTACMKAKHAQLSPECRAAMAAGRGGGHRAAHHHARHHR